MYTKTNYKQYPSVSAVLAVIAKPYIEKYVNRVGKEVADKERQQSSDFGKSVHTSVSESIGGIATAAPVEIQPIITSFDEWVSKNVKRWICRDVEIISTKHKYHGALDAIAELKDGTYAILEFKTSKKIQDDHYLQICAYAGCDKVVSEQDSLPPNFQLSNCKLFIVKLNKITGQWEEEEVSKNDQEVIFDIFLSALKIWKWKNRLNT